MITKTRLRAIRDQLPMQVTIERLGDQAPPSKHIEGYFRFLCPNCGELRATVNPKNNLSHCFCCGQNFNNIDLLIELGNDFKTAVHILNCWLLEHQTATSKRSGTNRR